MRPITLSTSDASGGAEASDMGILDLYISPFQVTLQTYVVGTVNYDVQYTKDDIWAAGYNPATGQWTSVPDDGTGETAATEITLISPVTAVRILQNSGSGSVSMRVIQAGIA